ncbi:MAG: hypothetical protein HKN44_10615 [Ilumatobacter sp.]|nr:hypothetical protein [Ilumatobacter sp.]
MSPIVVRYRPTPEAADENQRLVEAVFAELAELEPGGLRYATLRLADGTFIHIADIEGDENPLASTAAFGKFQAGIAERCVPGETPNPQPAELVGSYRMFAAAD